LYVHDNNIVNILYDLSLCILSNVRPAKNVA